MILVLKATNLLNSLKRIFRRDKSLSKYLDSFLEAALEEFNSKQKSLHASDPMSSFTSWHFDPKTETLELLKDNLTCGKFQCQILGTYAPNEGTFEWAWNSPNLERNSIVDSESVRRFGEENSVEYLQAGVIPVPEIKYLSYCCAIGVKLSGAIGIFHNSGGDVQLVLLVKSVKS